MDELGKSIPAAEAFVDAESGRKGKIINENCLNCGTKLIDTFCHHCGQKDLPRRQTLSELWVNFIASFWSYEGKFFQTTKYLITKPGYLAVEYNNGKRESYFHPARMYVFISFVFFLLYFSLPDPENKDTGIVKGKKKNDTTGAAANEKKSIAPMFEVGEDEDEDDFDESKLDSIINNSIPKDDVDNPIPAIQDSIKSQAQKLKKKNKGGEKWNFGLEKAEYATVEAYDSAENAKPEAKKDGWFKRLLVIRAIELNNKYKDDDSKSFAKDFGNAFKDNFSKVLFWLLPFFALVLKLLYVRRGFYYSEHLVFSIYYYNFFYLAGSVQMLLNQVSWLGWLAGLLSFWIYFYLLFGMKRMYMQGWGKTILKFFIFSFLFSILALIGLSVTALVVLMTI
ncbi:MAG TPA: DUF3667 domain-containing protein [Cyclobacteriaceae bacterium]|nr:DUF3667 domain-containing protein [Cyclobacteriaceae bacterium]